MSAIINSQQAASTCKLFIRENKSSTGMQKLSVKINEEAMFKKYQTYERLIVVGGKELVSGGF